MLSTRRNRSLFTVIFAVLALAVLVLIYYTDNIYLQNPQWLLNKMIGATPELKHHEKQFTSSLSSHPLVEPVSFHRNTGYTGRDALDQKTETKTGTIEKQVTDKKSVTDIRHIKKHVTDQNTQTDKERTEKQVTDKKPETDIRHIQKHVTDQNKQTDKERTEKHITDLKAKTDIGHTQKQVTVKNTETNNKPMQRNVTGQNKKTNTENIQKHTTGKSTKTSNAKIENAKPQRVSEDQLRRQENVIVVPIYPALWGGPVTYYNMFRWTLAFALYSNYSIIVTPFETHRTQIKSKQGIKTFGDTFDVTRLARYLKVLSLEDLPDSKIKDGNLVTSFALMAGKVKGPICLKYWIGTCNHQGVTNNASSWQDLQNDITVPLKATPIRSLRLYKNISTPNFIANIGAEPSLSIMNKTFRHLLDTSLRRAPYVRAMASSVYTNICDGNFAVLHWRNKTGECTIHESGSHVCTEDHYDRMVLLESAVDIIITDIVKMLGELNISCLYVATPVYEQMMVNRLIETKLPVYSITDILKWNSKLATYWDDNYVLSLVEQELAEMANLFISSRTSNWSYYVEYTRYLRNKRTVGMQELPGIPEELVKRSQTL